MYLRSTAHALGGDVSGHNSIAIPGPGHSGRDRSLSVTFDDSAPDGCLVNSFAGDYFAACRDHVRQLLVIGVTLLPAALAFAAGFLPLRWLGAENLAPLAGSLLGAVALLAEVVLGVYLVGRLLERFDLAAEAR